MAEKSYFWTTGVSGDGLATYTQVDLQRAMEAVAACHGRIGVAPSLLNVLAGTVGGANTVNIDTGGAMVDGRPYYNDASVSVNIPNSTAGNERIDRVVLRADWSARTVRVFRVAGTNSPAPTPPALTQISGTTWDLPLYQARVNSAGTVTLTDERQIARVATGDVADDAIDDTKAGSRVPQFRRRMGGDASQWGSGGSNSYTPTAVRIQAGVVGKVGTGGGTGLSGSQRITFPEPFSGTPIVVVSRYNAMTGAPSSTPGVEDNYGAVWVRAVNAAYVDVFWGDNDIDAGGSISWIAIGPE